MKLWGVAILAACLGWWLAPRTAGLMSATGATTSVHELVSADASIPPDESPPRKLSDAAPASAVKNPSASSQEVRDVIERELRDAPAEERQIWFDELKGLPPGIVEDLLRLRRQLNPRREPAEQPPGRLVPVPLTADTPVGDWSGTVSVLRRVRALHLQNLANVHSPGYRRLLPLTLPAAAPLDAEGESPNGWGCRWHGVRVDVKPGAVFATGRPLDVAIDGPGWFMVRTAEGLAFTRCGQLTIDTQQRLCVAASEQPFPLEPTVSCPAGPQGITIHPDGRVFGRSVNGEGPTQCGQIQLADLPDHSMLRYRANGLLALPAETEAAVLAPPRTAGLGSLVPRALERSNVAADEEWAEVERIDRWLNAVAR
jgi:flagellar basal body rod protein FlgG